MQKVSEKKNFTCSTRCKSADVEGIFKETVVSYAFRMWP